MKIKSRKIRIKRLKFMKLGVILVLMIFGLYSSIHVNAGIDDTTLDKGRIEGIYPITNINGVNRIFHLNIYRMNGRVAYCIDIGVDINTYIYNSTGDFSISNLSKEQLEFIRAVSYFGYQYAGHDDYKYYMAAQEIIWEYLSGVEVFWSTELSVNGPRIDIEGYKNEIYALVNSYNKRANILYDSSYYVNQEIVLLDNSNVLSDYEVVSSLYSDVSIVGNSLVIRVGNKIGREKILLKKKGWYGYDGIFYYHDVSQRLISNGNYKDVDTEIAFDIMGSTMEVKVVDEITGTNKPYGSASLEGAIYELYNSNDEFIGVYSTDFEGRFRVDNLLFGDYYFRQVEASRGYIVQNERIEFRVDSYDSEVEIMQYLIQNEIKINKIYELNGNYYPESGVVFGIYGEEGECVGTFTIDKNGSFTSRLAYGRYIIRQETTTFGYNKVDDFEIVVEKEWEDRSFYFVNELIRVFINVVTVDNGEWMINSGGFSYRIFDVDKNTYLELDGEDIFKTNEDGELLVPVSITYGDYILEQVDTPNGVLLNEEKIEFSVNDDTELILIDGKLVMEVVVLSEYIKGKLHISAFEEKFYSRDNEYGFEKVKRSKGEYVVIANDDIIANGKVKFVKGEEVSKKEINEDGELDFSNLYLGSYCVIDNETMEEQCFVLKSDNNREKEVEIDLEFVKELEKKNIIIQNVTDKDDGIRGSIFEVVDEEGEVIYTGFTNDDGMVKVEGLGIGNYCIRQKKVSNNYLLNEDKVCFVLDEDKEIRIVNKEVINKRVLVPDTLRESLGIYEALVVLLLIGTGIFVYKKIFVSN